jgi:hypothetical protein
VLKILGRTIDKSRSTGTDAKSKLGGDHYLIASYFPQETANQLLVLVWAIDFGRIEKVAAEFHVAVKNTKRFLVIHWSVGKGHAHASQSKRGNFHSIFSQSSVFHVASRLWA